MTISATSAAAWDLCKNPCRTCKPTPARAWTPCPRKSRGSRTTSRKLSLALASSTSSSWTFKLAQGLLHRGMSFVELGQKSSGIRDLREVVRRFPGSEEERYARGKLKELGVSVSATR